MKAIKLSQFGYNLHFKKTTEDDLKRDGSFKLTSEDGEVIAFFMIPLSGEKRNQLEAMASQMNSAIGISQGMEYKDYNLDFALAFHDIDIPWEEGIDFFQLQTKVAVAISKLTNHGYMLCWCKLYRLDTKSSLRVRIKGIRKSTPEDQEKRKSLADEFPGGVEHNINKYLVEPFKNCEIPNVFTDAFQEFGKKVGDLDG